MFEYGGDAYPFCKYLVCRCLRSRRAVARADMSIDISMRQGRVALQVSSTLSPPPSCLLTPAAWGRRRGTLGWAEQAPIKPIEAHVLNLAGSG